MYQFLFDQILKKRIEFKAITKRGNNEVKKKKIGLFLKDLNKVIDTKKADYFLPY